MVKIKICGLTTNEDVALVNALKCDLAGFVLFFEKSHRCLELSQARELNKKLDNVKSVAVTVSPSPEQAEAIAQAGFDFIQIHGKLTDEAYDSLTIPIIRAFNATNTDEIFKCEKMDKICGYVFDAAQPGSGKTFDWNTLKDFKNLSKTMLLAGGLTPENVADAIKAVKPQGVDVSSGVELKGGGKSPELTKKFVENARGALN